MTEVYFFDTYAFFEIIKQNAAYEKYTDVCFVTTKLNLFELYYGLLKDGNGDLASLLWDTYFPFAVDIDRDVLEFAAQFRYAHKNQKLSMTDCIGYVLAKKLCIPFLTGDTESADFENVVFVPHAA